MEGDGGSRRRLLYSDSASRRGSHRGKEDDEARNSLTGLTLSAVLGSEKRPSQAQVNQTLIDIIRDDPDIDKENKKSWKLIRDKLRLRRAGAAWTSTIRIPASDVPIQSNNRMMLRGNLTRFRSNIDDPISNRPELNSMKSNRSMMLRANSSRMPSISTGRYGRDGPAFASKNSNEEPQRRMPLTEELDEEEEEDDGDEAKDSEGEAEEGGNQLPVRMSLMALLAETDKELGLDGSTYMMDESEGEEEEEEEVVETGGSGGGYNSCCVCMVKHKGSAITPCGHNYCMLCSRELMVQRGHCPLCNGFILEILDIF